MLTVIIDLYYLAKKQLNFNNDSFHTIPVGIHYSQPKINQRGKIAITYLNHPQIENRVMAVYELEQLARDYPQNHGKIMEVLTAFVRNNHLDIFQGDDYANPSALIRPDIQAALNVIARRDIKKDQENPQLDLSYTDIRGANLHKANLELANLYQVNLSKANLSGANLCGVILTAANLSGANLRGANLSGAILSAANLSGANLSETNLSRANLYLANLHGAVLDSTILNGANLREAKLSGSDTKGVKMDDV